MKTLGIVVGAIVAANLALGASLWAVLRWEDYRARKRKEGELERYLQAETRVGMELLEEEAER